MANLIDTNNLSDVANVGTARANLGAAPATWNAPSGAQVGEQFATNGSLRWALRKGHPSSPESGGSHGGDIFLDAFRDNGSYAGTSIRGHRRSAPGLIDGAGNNPFLALAAADFRQNRATTPGQVCGNWYEWTTRQPDYNFLNALSTAAGSSTFTLAWPGHQWSHTANNPNHQAWVYLFFPNGSVNVGGALVSSGWYRAVWVDSNNVRFQFTGGQIANSQASGVGGSFVARPSFVTAGSRNIVNSQTGAAGFDLGQFFGAYFDPEFWTDVGQVDKQGIWQLFVSPKDSSHAWSMYASEVNVVNRGGDQGWYSDLFSAIRPVCGYVFVPEVHPFLGNAPQDQGFNSFASLVVGRSGDTNSTGTHAKWYHGLLIASDSLVNATSDPHGRGGAALSANGSTGSAFPHAVVDAFHKFAYGLDFANPSVDFASGEAVRLKEGHSIAWGGGRLYVEASSGNLTFVGRNGSVTTLAPP